MVPPPWFILIEEFYPADAAPVLLTEVYDVLVYFVGLMAKLYTLELEGYLTVFATILYPPIELLNFVLIYLEL